MPLNFEFLEKDEDLEEYSEDRFTAQRLVSIEHIQLNAIERSLARSARALSGDVFNRLYTCIVEPKLPISMLKELLKVFSRDTVMCLVRELQVLESSTLSAQDAAEYRDCAKMYVWLVARLLNRLLDDSDSASEGASGRGAKTRDSKERGEILERGLISLTYALTSILGEPKLNIPWEAMGHVNGKIATIVAIDKSMPKLLCELAFRLLSWKDLEKANEELSNQISKLLYLLTSVRCLDQHVKIETELPFAIHDDKYYYRTVSKYIEMCTNDQELKLLDQAARETRYSSIDEPMRCTWRPIFVDSYPKQEDKRPCKKLYDLLSDIAATMPLLCLKYVRSVVEQQLACDNYQIRKAFIGMIIVLATETDFEKVNQEYERECDAVVKTESTQDESEEDGDEDEAKDEDEKEPEADAKEAELLEAKVSPRALPTQSDLFKIVLERTLDNNIHVRRFILSQFSNDEEDPEDDGVRRVELIPPDFLPDFALTCCERASDSPFVRQAALRALIALMKSRVYRRFSESFTSFSAQEVQNRMIEVLKKYPPDELPPEAEQVLRNYSVLRNLCKHLSYGFTKAKVMLKSKKHTDTAVAIEYFKVALANGVEPYEEDEGKNAEEDPESSVRGLRQENDLYATLLLPQVFSQPEICTKIVDLYMDKYFPSSIFTGSAVTSRNYTEKMTEAIQHLVQLVRDPDNVRRVCYRKLFSHMFVERHEISQAIDLVWNKLKVPPVLGPDFIAGGDLSRVTEDVAGRAALLTLLRYASEDPSSETKRNTRFYFKDTVLEQVVFSPLCRLNPFYAREAILLVRQLRLIPAFQRPMGFITRLQQHLKNAIYYGFTFVVLPRTVVDLTPGEDTETTVLGGVKALRRTSSRWDELIVVRNMEGSGDARDPLIIQNCTAQKQRGAEGELPADFKRLAFVVDFKVDGERKHRIAMTTEGLKMAFDRQVLAREQWFSVTEAALRTISALSDKPELHFQEILHHMSQEVFQLLQDSQSIAPNEYNTEVDTRQFRVLPDAWRPTASDAFILCSSDENSAAAGRVYFPIKLSEVLRVGTRRRSSSNWHRDDSERVIVLAPGLQERLIRFLFVLGHAITLTLEAIEDEIQHIRTDRAKQGRTSIAERVGHRRRSQPRGQRGAGDDNSEDEHDSDDSDDAYDEDVEEEEEELMDVESESAEGDYESDSEGQSAKTRKSSKQKGNTTAKRGKAPSKPLAVKRAQKEEKNQSDADDSEEETREQEEEYRARKLDKDEREAREFLYDTKGLKSLVAFYRPICEHILKNEEQFPDKRLRTVAATTFLRMCMISERHCNENLELIFQLLSPDHTPDIASRASAVVGVGDLHQLYPNTIQPNFQQIYARLKDESSAVRLQAALVLRYIVKKLNRRSGTLIPFCLLLVDPVPQIRALAEGYFEDLEQNAKEAQNFVYRHLNEVIDELVREESLSLVQGNSILDVLLGQSMQKRSEKEKVYVERLCDHYADRERASGGQDINSLKRHAIFLTRCLAGMIKEQTSLDVLLDRLAMLNSIFYFEDARQNMKALVKSINMRFKTANEETRAVVAAIMDRIDQPSNQAPITQFGVNTHLVNQLQQELIDLPIATTSEAKPTRGRKRGQAAAAPAVVSAGVAVDETSATKRAGRGRGAAAATAQTEATAPKKPVRAKPTRSKRVISDDEETDISTDEQSDE